MSVYDFLTLIMAIAAVAGVVVWGLGGKSRQNTNDAITQENTSLRNQLGDALSANKVLEEKARKSAENEQTFKDIALGKPDYEKLSLQLTEQHKQLLNAFTTGTNKMASELGKLAKTIAKDRRNG